MNYERIIVDANTSANISNNHGFSSVSLVSPSQDEKPRRHSNASIASDISFLPRYEPSNMYHLQVNFFNYFNDT